MHFNDDGTFTSINGETLDPGEAQNERRWMDLEDGIVSDDD